MNPTNKPDFWFAHKFSKRRFLKTLSATALSLGIAPKAFAADEDETWDLIVIGGGNSGLPAAIFAARRGAKVLIIEAASQLGGTLFLSTGQMSAAGTKLQKSKGIEDSPQSHYDDVMRISKGTADPGIVRLAVFNAAETFDWLTDSGFEVLPGQPVTGTTHEPYSSARYAWGPEGGKSILKILEQELQPELDAGRVSVVMRTEATELIQASDGSVTGVVTTDRDGQSKSYVGHHILLSCGGYASNPEMYEELEGVKDYSDTSYAFSQGAGITLGIAAGGYVRGGEDHLPIFGGIFKDEEYPSPLLAMARHFPPERPPWEIYVNVNGKRFLREDVPSHDAHEEALRDQQDERCWVVFDDEIFRNAPPLVNGWSREEIADAFDGTPMFYKADSLDGLAEAASINPTALLKTVTQYNEGQSAGTDVLGRQHMPLPIAKAPFYAIRLQGWHLTGAAGLAVNSELRVIRQDGSPIPNLYAAGELLGQGQCMGRSYCGGMMVTPALTFGRLLGQRMLPFES